MKQFFEIKLGDQTKQMPVKFSHEQYMRLKHYPTNMDKVQLISACSGFDESLIRKCEMSVIEDVSNILAHYYFSSPPSEEIILSFFHNGVEYGLQKDFSKLSFGAWVDLEVYSSQDLEKNIPKILAVLYYPIKEWKKNNKYVLEDYDDKRVSEVAEEFKNVPMEVWHGVSTFFLLFVSKYIQGTVNSLNTKMTWNKIYQRGKKILPKWIQKKLREDFISMDSKF